VVFFTPPESKKLYISKKNNTTEIFDKFPSFFRGQDKCQEKIRWALEKIAFFI
jgi:hypothetical protein